MDIRQLTYFTAVVEAGSFTSAAEKLSIAQPSLSQQILNLEEELGEPLLKRSRRGVELTGAGGLVLTRARKMISEMDSLRAEFEQRSEVLEGEVKVGVIPTIAPFLLPRIIASFIEEHPKVKIHIREDFTHRLVGALSGGEIDFAIASDVEKSELSGRSLHQRVIFRESLLLAVPQKHELAVSGERVPLKNVPQDQLILLSEGHCLSGQVIETCKTSRRPERLECGQLDTLLSLVGAGLGVSIVPEMAAAAAKLYGVKLLRLANPKPTRLIGSLRRRSTRPGPVADAFYRHFTEEMDRRGL